MSSKEEEQLRKNLKKFIKDKKENSLHFTQATFAFWFLMNPQQLSHFLNGREFPTNVPSITIPAINELVKQKGKLINDEIFNYFLEVAIFGIARLAGMKVYDVAQKARYFLNQKKYLSKREG